MIACSSEYPDPIEEKKDKENPSTHTPLDLTSAISKRIEGNTSEALTILRSLAESHPDSIEVFVQLGRTLMEEKEFSLAAFRFEEALAKGAPSNLAKEAAQAHYLSKDEEAAIQRFEQYLSSGVDDPDSQLRYARLLAKKGNTTESINAFFKASEDASSDDCQLMGNLFLSKKLLPQAKHWFEESMRRDDEISPKPLLGLLQVAIAQGKESDAEIMILAIEKRHSGYLEKTDLSSYCANLIKRRRLGDLIARGIDSRNSTITELASGLLAGNLTPKKLPSPAVTSRGAKLSATFTLDYDRQNFENESSIEKNISTSFESSSDTTMSLADAFASPIENIKETEGAIESPLDLGLTAFSQGRHTLALVHARDVLKSEPKNPSAWVLCSQAHFQLGEIDAAEMTILEAIRHDPMNVDTRLEYLRIARETLASDRYLQELEKTRELFPDSVDILWELARRYHVVEKMPVTASILYQKVLEKALPESSIAQQAKVELIKIEQLP